MLIVHKNKFARGLILILSFAVLFWVMMLPLFHDSEGNRLTSLQYADTVFNELSKGSSWFVPEVLDAIKPMDSTTVNLSLKFARPELVPAALLELNRAGITDVKEHDGTISFSGNLGAILRSATEDAAKLYNNDGKAVSALYEGLPPLQISEAWWYLLNPCEKVLQKQGELAAARAVAEVVKKAVEPGNNFYGLPTARVSENILLVCGMLAFYVLYAIWYGFAIYNLFDGFGLLGANKAEENVEKSEI